MADLEHLALTRDRVQALTGLSRRQLDYWDGTGLVQPAVSQRVTPGRKVRLYGFTDLMSLLVVAELRSRNVSLQLIRKIVARLRERGYDEPLTQVRFATDRTRRRGVYFQHADGSWESDVAPDQLLIQEAIDLAPLKARIEAAVRRDPGTIGRIDRRRGALGSKPVIAGTRVPVETVRRYIDHGASTEEVLEAYPMLQPEDVEAVRRDPAA